MYRKACVYVILSVLLCDVFVVVVVNGAGTTPHLKDMFIGRCWQYQMLSEQNKIDSLKVDVNCTELWLAFSGAFAFQDPCNITDESYDAFFTLLDNPKKLTNVSP